MTCVVAVRDQQGEIALAGDSCAGSEWIARSVTTPKVFVRYVGESNTPIGIGYTHSFRMGQILNHFPMNNVVDLKLGDDISAWVVTRFVPWVRDLFLEQGFAEKRENQESGGTFLLVVGGHIFRVDDNYQVLENVDHYDAIGSGYMYAIGALAAMSTRLSAEERAKDALDIASYYSPWVKPPYTKVVFDKLGAVKEEKQA